MHGPYERSPRRHEVISLVGAHHGIPCRCVSAVGNILALVFVDKPVQGGNRQLYQWVKPHLEHPECLDKRHPYRFFSPLDSGRVREAPMRGDWMSRPERAGFVCGVIAERKDK